MLPILKKEIWDRKYSLIAYCVVGLGLIWMYVALFPSIQAASAQLDKIYQSFPKGVFQALGVEELSFGTLEKFLAVEMFSFMWPILAIVLALSRAGTTIAGEIEKGTIGLVLSLPLGRLKIFAAKYLAGLASVAVFVVCSIGSIMLFAWLYNQPVNVSIILKLAGLSALFMWVVYSAGICVSAVVSERSKVYMIVGSIVFLMYAANVVATLQASLRWLHRISIFNYYNAQDVLTKGTLKTTDMLVMAVLICLFTVIGAVVFAKRDVSV